MGLCPVTVGVCQLGDLAGVGGGIASGAMAGFGACCRTGSGYVHRPGFGEGVAQLGHGLNLGVVTGRAHSTVDSICHAGGFRYDRGETVSRCCNDGILNGDFLHCIGICEVLVAGLAEPILHVTVLFTGRLNAGEIRHRVEMLGNNDRIRLNASDIVADTADYTVYASADILGTNMILAIHLTCNGSTVYIPLVGDGMIAVNAHDVCRYDSAHAGDTAQSKNTGKHLILGIIGHIRISCLDTDIIAVLVCPTENLHAVKAHGSLRHISTVHLDDADGIVSDRRILTLRPQNKGDGVGIRGTFKNRRVGNLPGHGCKGNEIGSGRDQSTIFIHPTLERVALGECEGGCHRNFSLIYHRGIIVLANDPGNLMVNILNSIL